MPAIGSPAVSSVRHSHTGAGEQPHGFRRDLLVSSRWLLLGGAAGGWAGLLVGGVGGRLAMFVLRLTSPDYVRGIDSDDGFEIGRFSLDTVFLLGFTTLVGAFVGIVYVVVRFALPLAWRVGSWTVIGATVGGSLIVHADGVDFRLLEPAWLAVGLFVVIPAATAALMATWVVRWDRWWFTRRRRTVAAALPLGLLVPLIVPIAIAATGVVVVAAASQSRTIRLAGTRLGPPVGLAGLAIVAALSSWALFNDITEIL